MNDLRISYPHKPYLVAQNWGNANSVYASHFNLPDFKFHNGIDANVGGIPKFPVYCPVEGFVVDKVLYRPDGGGNEIWLISKNELQIFEEKCYAYLVLCHADKVLVKPGYEPALGELIMVADSTGFSTGPHTHMGLYRMRKNGGSMTYIDKNEATGSFNPALFFTEKYAVDEATLPTLITSVMRYYQYRMGL